MKLQLWRVVFVILLTSSFSFLTEAGQEADRIAEIDKAMADINKQIESGANPAFFKKYIDQFTAEKEALAAKLKEQETPQKDEKEEVKPVEKKEPAKQSRRSIKKSKKRKVVKKAKPKTLTRKEKNILLTKLRKELHSLNTKKNKTSKDRTKIRSLSRELINLQKMGLSKVSNSTKSIK